MGVRRLRVRQEGVVTIRSEGFMLCGSGGGEYDVHDSGGEGGEVEYQVVLKGIRVRFFDQGWGVEEKTRVAGSRKEQGNRLFEGGAHRAALWKYEEGLRCVEYEETEEEGEYLDPSTYEAQRIPQGPLSSLLDLKATLHLNSAACHQRLGGGKAAVAACGEALKLRPLNVKALYKRSVLLLDRGDLDLALKDITEAHAADPANGSVQRQLGAVRGRMAEFRRREKAAYGGFFNR